MLASSASANCACGFNASDPSVMWRTLERAKQRGSPSVPISAFLLGLPLPREGSVQVEDDPVPTLF
jgi:LamB/YcsF family